MHSSHGKITATYLRYGIVPVGKNNRMQLPGGDKSVRVTVLFDDEKQQHVLTYDPVNQRFFGVRGWYKKHCVVAGDTVTVEEIKCGELYRLRVFSGAHDVSATKDSLVDIRKSKKIGRVNSMVGAPINFRGLVYAPVNEAGVVLLFGMVYEELGMIVESVQSAFPDAMIRRFNGRGWARESVEFEYESLNFKKHGHSLAQCDMIVCWRDNWRNCPLEVCELSVFIEKLPSDKLRKMGDVLRNEIS